MRRLFFLSAFILLSAPLWAQTYYYERVKKVTDGVQEAASGDGHFITFNDGGCYDSDFRGITAGTGYRVFQYVENNLSRYYGKAYSGKLSYFYFSSDKSRLNIKEEGKDLVYVYVRKTAPSQMGPSVRGYRSPSSSSGGGAVSPLIYYVPTPGVAYSSSTSSGVSSSQGSDRIWCRGCNHTGHCTACKGTGIQTGRAFYTDNHLIVSDCPACHGSGKCGVCYGRGYIR